jgi:hypothetical protein
VLELQGAGEVLVLAHGLRVLRVQHDPGVLGRPAGAALHLIPGEAVFEADAVVGILRFVEKVAEGIAPIGVLLVAHGDRPVLHEEGLVRILAEGVAADLRGPAIEVLAIEDGGPFFILAGGAGD